MHGKYICHSFTASCQTGYNVLHPRRITHFLAAAVVLGVCALAMGLRIPFQLHCLMPDLNKSASSAMHPIHFLAAAVVLGVCALAMGLRIPFQLHCLMPDLNKSASSAMHPIHFLAAAVVLGVCALATGVAYTISAPLSHARSEQVCFICNAFNTFPGGCYGAWCVCPGYGCCVS